MNPAVEQMVDLDMKLFPIRREFIRLAAEADILATALCNCEDPKCPNHTADGITLGRVLVVMRSTWILTVNKHETVDRIPENVTDRLGRLLHAVGDAFDLWGAVKCVCGEPTCGLRDPRAAPVPLRLDIVERAWRVRGGCIHAQTPPDVDEVLRRVSRNTSLMKNMSIPLAELDVDAVRRVLAIYRAIRDLRWFRESDEQIAHSIHDIWGDDAQERLQRSVFQLACWGPVMKAEITPEDRDDFLEAANYLGCAVAVHGIVHPLFTHAFLTPFSEALDVASGLYQRA